MVRFFSTCLFLFGFLAIAQAQTPPKFAVYVGYALINEPNVTLEYRLGKRLAVNLEGGVFVPFRKEQNVGAPGAEIGSRINGLGGALRAGVAVYGKNRFGIMHRVMFDLTYFNSNPYQQRYGVQAVEERFLREFMQYAVFYEPTFRLAKDKRHHLFVRVGIGARGVWTHTVYSQVNTGGPGTALDNWNFRMAFAPVFSIGYRIRLAPQKGYFVREGP